MIFKTSSVSACNYFNVFDIPRIRTMTEQALDENAITAQTSS